MEKDRATVQALTGLGGLVEIVTRVDNGVPGAREQLEALIVQSTHDKNQEVAEESKKFWRSLVKEGGVPDGVDVEALIERSAQ